MAVEVVMAAVTVGEAEMVGATGATAMALSHLHPICRTGGTQLLLVAMVLPVALFAQAASRIRPVPIDSMEPVTGSVERVNAPVDRKTALDGLSRARQSFSLRTAGLAYDIKVSFQVDSKGQTNYDGVWTMEETFAPNYGIHWTARAASGYAVTRISSKNGVYQEGNAGVIPLRLQEVRGILFDPVQSSAYANRGTIRKSASSFHGMTVTCVLLSRSSSPPPLATGRDWEETEECFDPQTGLLQMHSEVPGRYVLYDYANAPRLGDRVLPRRATVIEGGRTVSSISVDSAELIPAPDPNLFTPTDTMKANGPAIAIGTATKMTRVAGNRPVTPATNLEPVCVFGVLSPAGRLVEAHSLQPRDPNSQAAVDDALQINFAPEIPAGSAPSQHFVFVVEEFPSGQ
ncbi:MAG TPA: hypothetical protein VKB79_14285 [Bryobacteraceae bacterium]|nr:hypothetical protein [Bryobacteraceae bacterium]